LPIGEASGSIWHREDPQHRSPSFTSSMILLFPAFFRNKCFDSAKIVLIQRSVGLRGQDKLCQIHEALASFIKSKAGVFFSTRAVQSCAKETAHFFLMKRGFGQQLGMFSRRGDRHACVTLRYAVSDQSWLSSPPLLENYRAANRNSASLKKGGCFLLLILQWWELGLSSGWRVGHWFALSEWVFTAFLTIKLYLLSFKKIIPLLIILVYSHLDGTPQIIQRASFLRWSSSSDFYLQISPQIWKNDRNKASRIQSYSPQQPRPRLRCLDSTLCFLWGMPPWRRCVDRSAELTEAILATVSIVVATISAGWPFGCSLGRNETS